MYKGFFHFHEVGVKNQYPINIGGLDLKGAELQTKTMQGPHCALLSRLICKRSTWARDGQTDLVQHFKLSHYCLTSYNMRIH